jgi:hypothetical protein
LYDPTGSTAEAGGRLGVAGAVCLHRVTQPGMSLQWYPGHANDTGGRIHGARAAVRVALEGAALVRLVVERRARMPPSRSGDAGFACAVASACCWTETSGSQMIA